MLPSVAPSLPFTALFQQALQLHPSGEHSQPFALMLVEKQTQKATRNSLSGLDLSVLTSILSQLQSCCISPEALLHPHPQSFPLCYSSHSSGSLRCSSVIDSR